MKRVNWLPAALGAAALAAVSTARAGDFPVVPSMARSQHDTAVASEAKEQLRKDPSLGGVQVDVRDGVARLTGTVPNASAESAAVSTVKGVPGVRKVEEDLAIEGD